MSYWNLLDEIHNSERKRFFQEIIVSPCLFCLSVFSPLNNVAIIPLRDFKLKSALDPGKFTRSNSESETCINHIYLCLFNIVEVFEKAFTSVRISQSQSVLVSTLKNSNFE